MGNTILYRDLPKEFAMNYVSSIYSETDIFAFNHCTFSYHDIYNRPAFSKHKLDEYNLELTQKQIAINAGEDCINEYPPQHVRHPTIEEITAVYRQPKEQVGTLTELSIKEIMAWYEPLEENPFLTDEYKKDLLLGAPDIKKDIAINICDNISSADSARLLDDLKKLICSDDFVIVNNVYEEADKFTEAQFNALTREPTSMNHRDQLTSRIKKL